MGIAKFERELSHMWDESRWNKNPLGWKPNDEVD
jgi:hypothetical protein